MENKDAEKRMEMKEESESEFGKVVPYAEFEQQVKEVRSANPNFSLALAVSIVQRGYLEKLNI